MTESVVTRILVPELKPADVEVLKADDPFLMRVNVTENAWCIGVGTLPSPFDMLGFSGAGGAPVVGYALGLTRGLTSAPETRIVAVLTPGASFPAELQMWAGWLGIIQVMGILGVAVEFWGEGGNLAVKWAQELSVKVYDSYEYQVPAVLKALTLQKLLERSVLNEGLLKPEVI